VLPAEPPAPGPADAAQILARDEERGPEPSIPGRSTIPGGEAEPSPVSLQAENAHLHAYLEDLRRENKRLWEQVREERTARLHEIELLNGLIASMRRA
jgi:hypothetical protein